MSGGLGHKANKSDKNEPEIQNVVLKKKYVLFIYVAVSNILIILKYYSMPKSVTQWPHKLWADANFIW